jgi:hypothetical protein
VVEIDGMKLGEMVRIDFSIEWMVDDRILDWDGRDEFLGIHYIPCEVVMERSRQMAYYFVRCFLDWKVFISMMRCNENMNSML